MKKKVLLVGLEYTGPDILDVEIDNLGLCRAEIQDESAAFALYEYDLIIINPESYSHFIFGKEGEFSSSSSELFDLKRKNNELDLDTVFDRHDRREEMDAALTEGARIIWLLTDEKREHFFGWRSNYYGYLQEDVEKIVDSNRLYRKKSRRLSVADKGHKLAGYFEQLMRDGWRICIDAMPGDYSSLAKTPEGYDLGLEIKLGDRVGWLLSPPTSQEGVAALICSALELEKVDVKIEKYNGVFLSHTSDDKPFVRKLKKSLEDHGVKDVWLDEAEIQIGDSLLNKIEEGMKKTKYIAVVLSPRSIASNWVKKELEIAINREISSGEVVVLPLVYERCDLPTFLEGKLYADFTSDQEYSESLTKLVRRLKK